MKAPTIAPINAPTKGINAIEHAVSFLGEVYTFNNRLKEDKNNAYELPYTTFNLGKIQDTLYTLQELYS